MATWQCLATDPGQPGLGLVHLDHSVLVTVPPRGRQHPAVQLRRTAPRGRPEPVTEKLPGIVKLAARPLSGGPPHVQVGGLMDVELRPRGHGHLPGLHVPGAVRRAGDVDGEPPQQPTDGRASLRETLDAPGDLDSGRQIMDARARRSDDTPLHRAGRNREQPAGRREQAGGEAGLSDRSLRAIRDMIESARAVEGLPPAQRQGKDTRN